MSTSRATHPVCEIFTSIQGEGTLIGAPSTFVRFSGCNLQCHWCDTPYAWKEDELVEPIAMTVDEILGQVKAHRVVLTGGEPLLQDLGGLLHGLGDRHVTLETNATLFRDYPRVDLWSLSPKLGSAGYRPSLQVIRRYLKAFPGKLQLKFVVGGPHDLAELQAVLRELDAAHVPVVLQPVSPMPFEQAAYLADFRRWVETDLLGDWFWRERDIRILPQFHRLLWGDAQGV